MLEKKQAVKFIAKFRPVTGQNGQPIMIADPLNQGQQIPQFLHPAKMQGNSAYYVVDLTRFDAADSWDKQTKNIVTCVFDGTRVFKGVQAGFANGEINADGTTDKPFTGEFYDVPLGGRYKLNFNNNEVEMSAIQVYISDGDNPMQVAARAVRNFIKSDNVTEIKDNEPSTAQQDALNAAAAQAVGG